MRNNLSEMREKRGLTQRKVAEITGLTVATISNVENSDRPISGKTAILLAECYGCSTDYILGLTETRK